jgi:hypothetical protein
MTVWYYFAVYEEHWHLLANAKQRVAANRLRGTLSYLMNVPMV